MSHNYRRSKQPRSNTHPPPPQHAYNPSIHPETFELENFVAELLQKECNGYIGSCESLKRIGIILNKYRLFIIKHGSSYNKTKTANNKRLGLIGIGSSHQPFDSMSIPHTNAINKEIDLLAIYQEQVYGNHQPMMNLKQTNSMYDFVNFKLGDNYNNISLLNDFHHLLYNHCSEYESIYNYLVQQIGTKCVASMCNVLQRNNNEFNLFMERDSIQEIETRQTINQIHCYFLHSFDIGYKFNDKELKTIHQYDHEEDDDCDQVFINSCIDEKLSIINKMIHKKHQYLLRNKYKSMRQHHSSMFNNLYKNYNKYISQMDGAIDKRFLYWDYYKTNMNIDTVNGGFMRDWFVTNKYNNLKEELLSQTLSIHIMDYLIERAKNLMQSDKSKRLRANSCNNTILLREYRIVKRSQITMDHILTLIVYSSNHLNRFTETFKYNKYQNLDELIVNHSQFAHFSRYLRESTQIFGQTLRSSDKLYHIVDGEYLFRNTVFSSFCPISCTNSLYVSCNIMNKHENGLILQLSRFQSNASYFDCKWISPFVAENEKLFFCSCVSLRISTILDIQNSLNYAPYICGINYLNCLLHSDKDQDSPSKYGKKAMAVLIENELNVGNNDYNIPHYIERLFTNYCRNKIKRISIDVDRINDRYYSLKKQLMTADDSWIDIHLLCTLFINVKQIVIRDGPYLTDNTFKQLISFMDKEDECKLTKIVFKYPKEEGIGVEEGIKTYYQAIKYRKWDTFYYQGLNDDLITMYFINNNIHIDDIGDIDYFAFELWKTLNRAKINDFSLNREVAANLLIHHIQQYFPNRFPSDDDILIMISDLIKYEYISILNHSDLSILANRSSANILALHNGMNNTNFRYKFCADKCRLFVKRSETFRQKWTIGSKVKIFSAHHRSWKHASIVNEIGDIVIVSFDKDKLNKMVDRYQENMITSISLNTDHYLGRISPKKLKKKRHSFKDHNVQSSASYYYSNNSGGVKKRWSAYYGSQTTGLATQGTTTAGTITKRHSLMDSIYSPSFTPIQRGSSRVSFGAVLKRPFRRSISSTDGPGAHHEIYHSGITGVSDQITPRTSTALITRGRRSTDAIQPEFAPCKGDPFWDYYRTIGDMSRANCNELIRVMKWISAEDIMKQLLQNWLHEKIEPISLPYANTNTVVSANFNLHAASVIAFVRQSLNSKAHPNCFDLPELTRYYNDDYDDEDDDDMDHMRVSVSNISHETVWRPLNIIGQRILSFLDQSSFLSACLVSRSWLYCARAPKARSHIRFRLWNALKWLIKDSDLMFIIGVGNDIVSINKFQRDRRSDCLMSGDEEDLNKEEGKEEDLEEEILINDILICYAAGKERKNVSLSSRFDLNRKRSTSHDSKNSFPHFFSRRINCCLFSNIVELQYDFNIPSHNKLIYYINQSLVDSYWDTLSVLFGIFTLRRLDILFPDPHILLAAYILQNSLTYCKSTFSSKRIVFPSIGVPKNKCICLAPHLSWIRFAVKSLNILALQDMINTHFEHYYHPIHHKHKHPEYKYHRLDDADYAQYVYAQSNKAVYSKLDIYKLCLKIIDKTLVFDISNALYSLNHSSNVIVSVEHISLCDVKCLNQELATFLNNNCSNLKSIHLMFTHKCILKANRIKQSVTQLFGAILSYLHKQTAVIHQHNHGIKKEFKLAKKKEFKHELQITYANKLKVLPLQSLSFSFPFDIDIGILDGYIDLFKFFTINDCLEISLKNVYLDGGCITPFTFNKLLWRNVLQSQVKNIQTLCMKRVLYSSAMFYSYDFSAGIVSQLIKIDLQIIYSDEYDDPYLHDTQQRQPIRELLESLSKGCQQLQVLLLDLLQHQIDESYIPYCTMNPRLDILWCDQFMKRAKSRHSLTQFHITFNELLTNEYEKIHQEIPKFIRRNHLNLGSIVRINPQFKDNMEQLIMSWFGECAQLNQVRLLRHIQLDYHAKSNRYKMDKNVDFQNVLPFQKKYKLNVDQCDHNKAFYAVSKRKKVGDFYRGEVFGELTKILQPQNPIE